MLMRVLCLALLLGAGFPRQGMSCCAPSAACCGGEHGACPMAPGGHCSLSATDQVTALPTSSPDVAALTPTAIPATGVAYVVSWKMVPTACVLPPHDPPERLPLRI